VIAVTILLSRLRTAAPVVQRESVWIDTVKRGLMLREVQGQGTLVPEEIRWLSATAPARVERTLVKPGSRVSEQTVLLQLANPDLELSVLEADRGLAAARAELVNLQSSQDGQRLAQESLVATLRAELSDAKRRAAADQELAAKGFLSALELAQTKGKADELGGRVGFELKRLDALSSGLAAQLTAQRAQVERLRSIAAYKHREVEALAVRAGVSGVLQELPLQVGQWVAAGTLLAKVAQPERLKAEIRISEIQAKDVQPGQQASVDTYNGVVRGHVLRVDPAVQAGAVKVDIALDGELPAGARPDLSVQATIELERLPGVLFVGRPAFGHGEHSTTIFRLDPATSAATRVPVQLGKSSAKTIEITAGLREGDQVILSDLSAWQTADRIRLK
jgi:multidrug efflux pump subunit AcrA (membrane-fusion protein)